MTRIIILLFTFCGILILAPSQSHAIPGWQNIPTPSPRAQCENKCVDLCVQFFNRCTNSIPTEPLKKCRNGCDQEGGNEERISSCYDACYFTEYLTPYENCEDERSTCEDLCYDVFCIDIQETRPPSVAITTPQPSPSPSSTPYARSMS